VKAFRASAVQLKAGGDQGSNLASAALEARAAAADGADLVVLPEVFAWRGPQRMEPSIAEPAGGPASRFVSELARELGVHVLAGSILERLNESKCYNTSLLFGPDGAELARYRKIHLFEVDIDGQMSVHESNTREPGDEVVCVSTELGRIGLSICYDLRFPELYRQLADQGAEIVLLPAAFTAPTGQAHWHALIRARAIENQCFIVAANQFGENADGFSDYGHSMIVDPWGVIMAEAGEDGPCRVEADLEPARLAQVRSSLPSLKHRRLSS
jgi:predicted amidohydrolase